MRRKPITRSSRVATRRKAPTVSKPTDEGEYSSSEQLSPCKEVRFGSSSACSQEIVPASPCGSGAGSPKTPPSTPVAVGVANEGSPKSPPGFESSKKEDHSRRLSWADQMENEQAVPDSEFPPLGDKSVSPNPLDIPQGTAPSSPKKGWREMFGGNITDGLKLSYVAPSWEDGELVANPPPIVAEKGVALWKTSLVGQFFGKPPPFTMIRNIVSFQWRKFTKVEVKSTEDGLYIFKLDSEEACDKVLEQLWHIGDRPMLLRKWKPGTQLLNIKIDKVPIWVKLRNVPLEYWSAEGFSYLGSVIGVPLQMDAMTESRSRLGYARICIEVGVEQELPESIPLRVGKEKMRVDVEYAWRPQSCTFCKCFGHHANQCVNKPSKVWKPTGHIFPVDAPYRVSPPAQEMSKVQEPGRENEDGKVNEDGWQDVNRKFRANAIDNHTSPSPPRNSKSPQNIDRGKSFCNPFEALASIDGQIEEFLDKANGNGEASCSNKKDEGPISPEC